MNSNLQMAKSSSNRKVATSPSPPLPDQHPEFKSIGKGMGTTKAKGKPKSRRSLSGYNFYMKYYRTVTVSPGMTLAVLDDSLTHEEKRKHVLEVLERDPYRLQCGQKRRHRKTHGAIDFKELTIQVASSWRNLDDRAKSVFMDVARQAKHQNKKQEDDSSTESRRPQFDVQSTTQGPCMQAIFEEALSIPNTFHFQSNDSTPSASTVSTGIVAASQPSLNVHKPIIHGNLSTYMPMDAYSSSPAPLKVTSQVQSLSESNRPVLVGMSELSEEGRSVSNSELASFLSWLDWSRL
jgi:hypothetical protein